MSITTRVGLGCVAVLLLSGCGGSSRTAHDTAPTEAASNAAATAINLTAADVGAGFKATPHQDTPDADAMGAQLAACMGASDPKTGSVVDVSSDDFSRGGPLDLQQVSSSVSVLKSTKQAHGDLAALTGYRATGCVEVFVNKLLRAQVGKTPNVSFSPSIVAPLDVSTTGTDGGFGYSISTTVSAGTLRIPVEIDLLGALKRHTEVALDVVAMGHAFPTAEREGLFAKLVARTAVSSV